MDEIVLAPEMSPFVFMKSAVVPALTFLPALSEVFSLAVYEDGNSALDVVSLRVEQSCLRMNSEDTLPALQDEPSVMSFLVWPAAVLISQFLLSYDECGDDGFSPEVRVSGSLVCQVDLDSLWMIHWDDRRTVETGSHTGVSVWRRVLRSGCSSLGTSEISVFWILMLGRRMYTPVQTPASGVETVAWMPFFPHCQVAVVPSDTVVQVRGCTRMRGCTGNEHSPGGTQDARKFGVPPGERCAEDSVVGSSVYVWSVTGSHLFRAPLRCVRGICLLGIQRGLCWLGFGSPVVWCGGV